MDISNPSHAQEPNKVGGHDHVVHAWDTSHFTHVFPTDGVLFEAGRPTVSVVEEACGCENSEECYSPEPVKRKAPLASKKENDGETESKHAGTSTSTKCNQRSVESDSEFAAHAPPLVSVSRSIHRNRLPEK